MSVNYRPTSSLVAHEKAVSSLKFSPSGAILASAGADSVAHLWRVDSFSSSSLSVGPSAALSEVHEAGLNDLSWSADSSYLATASDDATIGIWDIESQMILQRFKGHKNHVFCVCFNPQGNLLASGSFDERLILWDLRSAKICRTMQAHSDPISGVDFHPEGNYVVTGSYDGLCRLWDSTSGQCLKTIYYDKSPPVSHVKFSPNGKYILASYLDQTIRLWKYDEGRSVRAYKGHQNSKYCLSTAFSMKHKEKLMITGSEDGSIRIFDVHTKQCAQVVSLFPNSEDAILAVDCHPNIPLIAAGGLGKGKNIQILTHPPIDSQMDQNAE
jgi:COMPASS component SWD3